MTNQSFFNATFIARKARVLRNGEVPIILRITIAGQRAELNINRTVNPNMWVAAKGMSRGKSRADIELNRYLETVRAKLLAIHTQMVAEGALINPDTMKKRFLGVDEQVKVRMFLETFRENNEKYRKRLELGDISEGTVLRWERCVVYLEEYLKSHKNVEDIPLRDVTLPLIDDFDLWLRTVKECGHNCAIRYISTIRKIFRDAVNYKWIDRDPFYGKTYSKKKTNREHLTEAELNAMMSLDLKLLPRLETVRDVFVFCCFTGLAFIDVSTLNKSQLVENEDGEMWIKKPRQKTGEISTIPLLGIPAKIIEKYKDDPMVIAKGVLLPVISNQRMNSYLADIASLAKVKKHLTTHIARHTFATMSLRNHVPLETISKMLGHSDIQTTQIYAKMVDEAISEDMQKMRSKFDKMEDAVTPLKEKPTDFVREPPKKRGRPRKNPL